MSWSEVTLGEAAEIVSGATPRSSNPEYWDGDVLWATPTDLSRLNSKFIDKTARTISAEGLDSCSARILPSRSVLFSSRAPIGLVAINRQPMATNQGFKSFVPKPFLDPNYLYWWLKANRDFLQDLGNGATFKEVSKSVVARVTVPLPPIEEQQRIASILDRADAIRCKQEDLLRLADELAESAFIEMFGNPVTNLRGWSQGVIGDCLSGAVGGWSAKGESRPAEASEMGVLKISSVTTGEYMPTENKAVPFIPPQKTLIVPQTGDLLFSRANTRELVAATCIVLEAPQNVFLPDKLWRLDVDSKVAEASYLKLVLSHPEYRQRLCARATGTSGSMLNISKAKLVENPIPLPPIELQRAFAKVWLSANRMKIKIRHEMAQTELLFGSLTQRAFRGEL